MRSCGTKHSCSWIGTGTPHLKSDFIYVFMIGSCGIGDLYQFVDKTGVLSTHEQCLAQLYEDRQVDMKMIIMSS